MHQGLFKLLFLIGSVSLLGCQVSATKDQKRLESLPKRKLSPSFFRIPFDQKALRISPNLSKSGFRVSLNLNEKSVAFIDPSANLRSSYSVVELSPGATEGKISLEALPTRAMFKNAAKMVMPILYILNKNKERLKITTLIASDWSDNGLLREWKVGPLPQGESIYIVPASDPRVTGKPFEDPEALGLGSIKDLPDEGFKGEYSPFGAITLTWDPVQTPDVPPPAPESTMESVPEQGAPEQTTQDPDAAPQEQPVDGSGLPGEPAAPDAPPPDANQPPPDTGAQMP